MQNFITKKWNFETYAEQMEQAVAKQLPDVTVKRMVKNKNNNIRKTGLLFEEKGNDVTLVIYLEELYQKYVVQEQTIEQSVEELIQVYLSSKKRMVLLDKDFSWEHVKEKIVYKIVHKKWNQELLENAPHIDCHRDFSFVYLILSDTGTVQVQPEHLKSWGINEKTLQETAFRNMETLLPPVFMPVQELLLNKMAGIKEQRLLGEGCNEDFLYILTNRSTTYGATLLFSAGVLEKIGEVLESDYWVLPSSVHEVIILKESDEHAKEWLSNLVWQVNKEQVAEEEWLSDRAYFYSRESGELR